VGGQVSGFQKRGGRALWGVQNEGWKRGGVTVAHSLGFEWGEKISWKLQQLSGGKSRREKEVVLRKKQEKKNCMCPRR